MADEGYEGSVTFGFEIEDNVSAVSGKIADGQQNLSAQVQKTTADVDRQAVAYIKAMSALNGFRGGMNQTVQSVKELGLVDDETYQTLRKVAAGMQLVTGTAEMLKGAAGIMNMLTASTKGFAVASAFAAITANPLKGALILAGAGAAVGGMVYVMNQQTQQSSTTNNITFVNGGGDEDTRGAQQAIGGYY